MCHVYIATYIQIHYGSKLSPHYYYGLAHKGWSIEDVLVGVAIVILIFRWLLTIQYRMCCSAYVNGLRPSYLTPPTHQCNEYVTMFTCINSFHTLHTLSLSPLPLSHFSSPLHSSPSSPPLSLLSTSKQGMMYRTSCLNAITWLWTCSSHRLWATAPVLAAIPTVTRVMPRALHSTLVST
jgi:hypothetical protein